MTLRGGAPRGFTLVELLVVLAILAVASALVVLSVRDDAPTRLMREADRLIAQLETTRALARSNAQALLWQPVPGGYQLGAQRESWLDARTTATLRVGTEGAPNRIALGPEPLILPTEIELQQGGARRRIRTDGLRPFEVAP